jgi:capsule polysaccharide export protein KpsE/RkpR
LSDAGIGLSDFVLPLARRRRLITWIVGAAIVGSVAAALLWPKSWRATTTLLPPERRMDNPLFVPGGFEGLGAGLRSFSLRPLATPTDIFVAILESRNVAESLVGRFGLQEEYDAKTLARAIVRLQRSTQVTTTADGTIQIAAVASSADLAARLANAYVEELDRVNRTLANREATAVREFVETELADAKVRLSGAEDSLRSFQENYGAIEVTEQAKAVIAAAARIRGEIVAAEVELGVLQRTRDQSHPDVQRAKDYLAELRLRLSEMEGEREATLARAESRDVPPGQGTNGDHGEVVDREAFPPLSKVPALGLRFGRLLRDVKTEEAVVSLLTEQYHRARIEERRSLPTVRVLDAAVPPERRFRPRRTVMVLTVTAAAVLLSVMLAYGLEVFDRIRREPEKYAALHRVAADLRKGLRT